MWSGRSFGGVGGDFVGEGYYLLCVCVTWVYIVG